MDARCRIELLGQLRVTQGERVITRFRTQKTGALLGYLAYHSGRGHPREILIDVLWPEAAPAAGRHSLNTAISSLRRQLEPPGVAKGSVIQADRSVVQLSPAAVITDVAEFQAARRAAAEADSDAERAQALLEALDLYRGELLPGYYEDWVISEQRRLARLYFRTVRWLTAYLEGTGDLERAVECARRAVTADPLWEEGYQDVMRLLAAAGQPSEALHQYRELERILKEELGAAPSEATRDLARRIERRVDRGEAAAGLVPAPTPPPPMTTTGIVTFLVTEIEDARRLRREAGDGFRQVLEVHDGVIRGAIAQYGGRLVKETEGTFIAAFAHPADAAACAIECQRSLAAVSWPAGVGGVGVRLALDTGDVRPRGHQPSGWLLRLGTGLLLAAHGGQILCSEVTAGLVRSGLPPEVRLTDLGYYRLRGVEEAERLFAVAYPGMVPETFPPPKALPAYTTNLPVQLTTFFGREEELSRLEEILLAEGKRLVTLVGAGGSGKTRLAIEAACHASEAFRGAVWYAGLQDLVAPRLIVDTILSALRLPPQPTVEPLEQVVTALSRQRSLVILDNFEHLVDEGSAVVRTLLERAPTLTCLVTSRRLLDLTGEQEFHVAPLPVPRGDETPEGLMRWASVQLLTDRAQAVRPDFQVTAGNASAVSRLCYGLEGIPLALELAGARVRVMTPAQMVAGLERRFDFLVSRKRDVARRHRTVWAAVEWSYRLLAPEVQRLFARLSVFRGGWTAETAAAVCEAPQAIDHLGELEACSLILAEASADQTVGIRFRMLETIREYAWAQLSAEEQAAVARRHAEHYLALATDMGSRLQGPEQARCFTLLDLEHGNLRAALDYWQSSPDGTRAGLRLTEAMWRFWERRGHVLEGRARIRDALGREDAAACAIERAPVLEGAGRLSFSQSDYAAARAFYEESLAVYRVLGDTRGVATELDSLGSLARYQGDTETARRLQEEAHALFRQLGDTYGIYATLGNLALIAKDVGDYARSREMTEETLKAMRALGHKQKVAVALSNLGVLALQMGDAPEVARRYHEDALAVWAELGDRPGRAMSLFSLGNVALWEGNIDMARARYDEALAAFRDLGDLRGVGHALTNLGAVAEEDEEIAVARDYYEQALAIHRQRGDVASISLVLVNLAGGHDLEGDYPRARALLKEALILARDRKQRLRAVEALEHLANVHIHEGLPNRAARLLGAAEVAREATGVPSEPRDRTGIEENAARLQAALGEEAFRAKWVAGRSLSVDEAIAYALEGLASR